MRNHNNELYQIKESNSLFTNMAQDIKTRKSIMDTYYSNNKFNNPIRKTFDQAINNNNTYTDKFN